MTEPSSFLVAIPINGIYFGLDTEDAPVQDNNTGVVRAVFMHDRGSDVQKNAAERIVGQDPVDHIPGLVIKVRLQEVVALERT